MLTPKKYETFNVFHGFWSIPNRDLSSQLMVGCAVAFLAVAVADVDFQGAGVGSTEPELEAFMANETRQGRPPHTPVMC